MCAQADAAGLGGHASIITIDSYIWVEGIAQQDHISVQRDALCEVGRQHLQELAEDCKCVLKEHLAKHRCQCQFRVYSAEFRRDNTLEQMHLLQ